VKRTTIAIVAVLALAGCQARLTLEEARALCEQKGGLLAVIYTQKITASGVGAPVGSPGECIQSSKFAPSVPPPKATPPAPKEQP